MDKRPYIEQLRDPRWQRRRTEIMQRDDYRCVTCEDSTSTLHVHHKRYIKGRSPWEYEDEDLETLCEKCHEKETRVSRQLKAAIDRFDSCERAILLGCAKGLLLEWDHEKEVVVEDGEELVGLAGVTDRHEDHVSVIMRKGGVVRASDLKKVPRQRHKK